MNTRLKQQFDFLVEIDKLKLITRQTRLLCDNNRRENDAEHSWHLALYVMILKEYSNVPDLDWLRVIKMVLIHDLVEIYAGDVFIYDDKLREQKKQLEQEAANKLFAILPDDQCSEMHALWNEYENKSTPEAKFAAVVDKLQPFLHNYYNATGGTWRQGNATRAMENRVMSVIAENSEVLGEFLKSAIDEAVLDGRIIA